MMKVASKTLQESMKVKNSKNIDHYDNSKKVSLKCLSFVLLLAAKVLVNLHNKAYLPHLFMYNIANPLVFYMTCFYKI